MELGNAALPVNTVLDTSRMAGLISTGSHGVGRSWGSVSDFIDSLTAVDGSGRLVVYNSTSHDFNQARSMPRPGPLDACTDTDLQVNLCNPEYGVTALNSTAGSRECTGSSSTVCAKHSLACQTIGWAPWRRLVEQRADAVARKIAPWSGRPSSA